MNLLPVGGRVYIRGNGGACGDQGLRNVILPLIGIERPGRNDERAAVIQAEGFHRSNWQAVGSQPVAADR